MKPTLTISANATPGAGGQGLNFQHMLEAYSDDFELRVFSGGPSAKYKVEPIAPSRIARALGRLPLLRRLRDWQDYFASSAFDSNVAKRLTRCDLFQGVAGQCLRSIRRAKKLGARTVVDALNPHAEFFYRELALECARFGIRPLNSRAIATGTSAEYEHADVIRVMSKVSLQTFVERGIPERKLMVAYPPIQLENFPKAEFKESVFRVVFVGLIEPWKGFHYLVEAFNAMQEPERELVFWGGTGARPIAKYFEEHMQRNPKIKIRNESVRKAGFQEVYGKASVLVLPSLAEGFGLVVAEAMASGIPVIVTTCTGAADFVIDGTNGYVVPTRNSAPILERLNFLAANPSRLAAMGNAAAESIKGLTLSNFQVPLKTKLKDLLVNP